MNHFYNYPPINGPAMINTVVDEDAKEGIQDNNLYFSFNDAIFTLIASDTPKVRLIMRDCSGKYSWDCQFVSDTLQETAKMAAKGYKFESVEKTDERPDLVLKLLNKLESETSELGSLKDSANGQEETAEIRDLIVEFDLHKQKGAVTFKDEIVKKSATHEKLELKNNFRLLLNSLGFLSLESIRSDSFMMLTKGNSLYRDIRGLDRKFGREVIKVAVLYVAPDQFDEQSILKNQVGSKEYREFMDLLGDKVNLESHVGYFGGLDKSMSLDGTAVYYCNSSTEVMFHDACWMPTDESDLKQVKKKRHIGNDSVHIVWNDNYKEYKNCIRGDFGNAIIVITPLKNELYKIAIERDVQVKMFGPLINNMLVKKTELVSLVKATVINANRVASLLLSKGGVIKHPYGMRLKDIRIIKKRHIDNAISFTEFMKCVLQQ